MMNQWFSILPSATSSFVTSMDTICFVLTLTATYILIKPRLSFHYHESILLFYWLHLFRWNQLLLSVCLLFLLDLFLVSTLPLFLQLFTTLLYDLVLSLSVLVCARTSYLEILPAVCMEVDRNVLW